MNVAVLGYGTVGSGVVEILKDKTICLTRGDIAELQIAQQQLKANANKDAYTKRIEIKAKADEVLFEKETEERTLAKRQRELSVQNSRLDRDKESLKELQGKFRELQERKFDENSLFCKLCGQPLPLTDREALKGDYERNRTKELNEITTRGNALNDEIKFGTIDTFLLWKLTNGKVHATDYTNASRTMLFNIKTLEWDDEILKEPKPDVYAKEISFKQSKVKVSFWVKDFNSKDKYKLIITNEIRKYVENGWKV